VLTVLQIVGNTAMGGAERHVLDLSLGLRARGVAVRVIVPGPGPLVQTCREADLPTTQVPFVRPLAGDEYALDPAALYGLARVMADVRPDVVHSHLHPAHLHGSPAAAGRGVPAIVHTAHTLVTRPADRRLAEELPVRTIAVSLAVQRSLESAGVPPERITLIRNGIAPPHLAPAPAPFRRAAPVLTVVSRLAADKHVHTAIACLALLRRIPAPRLLVVGSGPLEAQLRRLRDQLSLKQTVQFLGSRDDVPSLLRNADVVLAPSPREASPLAVLEAMAAARPVIGADAGGIPELIGDGRNGRLAPADDPAAFARAARELAQDPAAATRIGLAARDHIIRRDFTVDRMVDQTLRLYRRILCRHRTG
jgi:glycosyltransferase involved in cell wall biosynthesis